MRRCAPPYNRVPQTLRLAAGHRLDGAHVGGCRRVRGFPPADTHHRPARLPVADRRLDPTGRRVVGDGQDRCAPAPVRFERNPAGRAQYARLRDSDHVGRRQSHVRARLECRRPRFRADPRAPRLLCLRAVQEPEPGAGVRHGARRFQFRPAVQREPLYRQRSHRRRQPAHAGAVVADHRHRDPAPSACGWPSANGSTSRTSASC